MPLGSGHVSPQVFLLIVGWNLTNHHHVGDDSAKGIKLCHCLEFLMTLWAKNP